MSEITSHPSGLSDQIHGMKVREERILTDWLAQSGGQVDELLAACREETLNAGCYGFGEKPIDWSVVLQDDLFHALPRIRALTYGPVHAFAVNCGAGLRACRARIEWELDLAKLPCRPLSEESRAALLAGNRFETTLPDAGQHGIAITDRCRLSEDVRNHPLPARMGRRGFIFSRGPGSGQNLQF